jgi:hypothetical protein
MTAATQLEEVVAILCVLSRVMLERVLRYPECVCPFLLSVALGLSPQCSQTPESG